MLDKKTIKVEKALKTDNPSIILLRTTMLFDFNIEKIFNLITNLSLRVKWEAILSKMKVLKIYD